MSTKEQMLDEFTDDELEALHELAQAKATEGFDVDRRDMLALLTGGALGGGAAFGAVGNAAAQASTTDSDGNVGLPSDRVDLFADGADVTGQIDFAGSPLIQAVAASGSVTLSGDTATVDTGISATGATFFLALGVDDPATDAKIVGSLFWDDSAGTYKIEITETIGGVDPTVNYKVIRVD